MLLSSNVDQKGALCIIAFKCHLRWIYKPVLSCMQYTAVINPALEKYFPVNSGVKIIAEPGRYYVASAFTLAVNIIAKNVVMQEQSASDGIKILWCE